MNMAIQLPPAPSDAFVPTRPKLGLALGSGVARGWAHIGVMRALYRLGIKPDIICGSSVGALVGGCYLAGKLDALENWARTMTRLRMVSYLDLRMRSGGLIGGNRLTDDLREHLGYIRIQDLPLPFAAVATDLVTGHEIWLREGLLADALRASFSLPGVMPPTQHQGRWLVDGALVNPVPVSTCRALGADMVISVNLSADLLGKTRRAGSSIPTAAGFDLLKFMEDEEQKSRGAFAKISSMATRIFKRDYDGPSLFGVMVASLNILQDRVTRSRMASEPPDVQISPRLGHIGLLEFDRAEEVIAEGETAVARAQVELGEAFKVFFQNAPQVPAQPNNQAP